MTHKFNVPDGFTARCWEKIAAFDYEVQHRPGKSIEHADGLSRFPAVKVQSVQTVPNKKNPHQLNKDYLKNEEN